MTTEALTLSTHTYPALPDHHDPNPALLYLSKLASTGRRSMRIALERILRLLGTDEDVTSFPWGSLRYAHTTAIRSKLVVTLDVDQEPHFSVSTVNTTIAALRGVLKEAWRLGQLDSNEYERAADIANVKATRIPKGRAVTHGEVLAMVETCRKKGTPSSIRDAAVLALGWAGGLRRSEIVAVQIDDYDCDAGRLVVRSGKGRRDRVVGLRNGAAHVLDAWLQIRGDGAGALLQQVRKGGTITGKPMTGEAIVGLLVRLARRSGVNPFTAHDLRRSFITSHLERGTDALLVSRMVGHASTDTTKIYDRRGEQAILEAAGTIAFPW